MADRASTTPPTAAYSHSGMTRARHVNTRRHTCADVNTSGGQHDPFAGLSPEVAELLARAMLGERAAPHRKLHTFRFPPWLIEEVRERVGKRQVTALIEELLMAWLEQVRAKPAMPKPAPSEPLGWKLPNG